MKYKAVIFDLFETLITEWHPYKRESIAGFLTAEEPLDILQYIE